MNKFETFDEPAKKLRLRWFVLAFIIVLIVIGFGVVSKNLEIPFTGNQIKQNTNNSIEINAKLDQPKMQIKGDFNELIIKNPKDTIIYFGNTKLSLDNEKENEILIKNFEGKIEFDSEKIILLEGKSSEIKVNEVPLSAESDDKSKIRLEGNSKYDSFSIRDNLFIDKLTYKTSGLIELIKSGDLLTIKDEEVTIKEFLGSIESSLGKINITGKLKELEIKGEKALSVKA